MIRLRSIIILFLILVPIVIICMSCSTPPENFRPLPLTGEYTGTYLYTDDQIKDTLNQAILWTFTEDTYEMKIDTASAVLTDFCICETYGNYVLGDKINLSEQGYITNDSICLECDTTKNPEGEFHLDRSTSTLTMVSEFINSENIKTYRNINIVKVIR